MYVTVNYLFAAYLQTRAGGNNKLAKVELIRRGRAKFFFDITDKEATDLKFKFHSSCCLEFETKRKFTIDLAY